MISSFLLPGSLLLHAICISAAPYIVTSYIEVSAYTYSGRTDSYTTRPASVDHETEAVIPMATPVLNALSTSTDDLSYAEVTIIDAILPFGSGATPSINNDYESYSTPTYTSYVVPITYTPSPTCTGQSWTFVTNVPVEVPLIVQTQFSPITVSASATTYSYADGRLTRTTAMVAILNPTDISADDLASASSEGQPDGLSSCYTPTTYCATQLSVPTCTTAFTYDYGTLGSSGSSNYPAEYDSCYYGDCWLRNLILIAVFVPVGWILLWLILGLWESWMSFKGIMLGKHRKRGIPYSWCCISFLFLCWVGPTYKGKSIEEQAVLLERWKAMKAGEKFKLWLRWGFRWKYPDMLGQEPEIDKRAFRQRCL